ncbi:hypothetical protein ACA910_018033 [Epithemia clementina (nom. ined.)]
MLSLWKELKVVLLAVSLLDSVNACDFCPEDVAWTNGGFHPIAARANFYVANGKTCNTVYDEVQSTSTSSSACSTAISKYRQLCCYSNTPATQAPQTPRPVNPDSVIPQGTEPVCDICIGGGVPSSPNTMVFSNFISGGRDTCMGLYNQGRAKNILAALCYPLQLFAKTPCGCNGSSPSPPSGSSPSPPSGSSPSPPTGSKPRTPAPTFPRRVYRPPANKNQLKESLVQGYRTRGSANDRFLTEEQKQDEEASRLRGVSIDEKKPSPATAA